MFKCHVCGNTSASSEFVNEVFTLEGDRRALVEHIPAQVCERCGEPTFSIETPRRFASWFTAPGDREKPCRWKCSLWHKAPETFVPRGSHFAKSQLVMRVGVVFP